MRCTHRAGTATVHVFALSGSLVYFRCARVNPAVARQAQVGVASNHEDLRKNVFLVV